MKTLIWITLFLILLMLFNINDNLKLSEADKARIQEQKELQLKQEEQQSKLNEQLKKAQAEQNEKFAALPWAEVPRDRKSEWVAINILIHDQLLTAVFMGIVIIFFGLYAFNKKSNEY